MSTIKVTPQKPKDYDGRTQNHADAAEQKGHFHGYITRRRKNKNALLSELDLKDLSGLKPAELEKLANEILDDSTFGPNELIFSVGEGSPIDDSDIEPADRPIYTEAELGVKSRHEIARAMAEAATMQFSPDDDKPDPDFNSPIKIRYDR